MKSVLQNLKTGEVSVTHVPQPALRDKYVLVRNVCSLISAGTERAVLEFSNASMWRKARLRPDLFRKVLNRAKNEGWWQTYQVMNTLMEQHVPLGYSSAGIVVDTGAEVDDLVAGQRVACAGLLAATHAEVVAVPRHLVTPLPEAVGFEAACFVTLGAIAMQGVRLAELSLSEHVVIYGLGLVGLLTAQLALAAGSRVIGVDIDAAKVERAVALGCEGCEANADLASTILSLTGGYGADKVILCAATRSNDPIERVPSITRQKGVLVVIGDVSMHLSRRDYYEKEIDVRVSRAYGPGR